MAAAMKPGRPLIIAALLASTANAPAPDHPASIMSPAAADGADDGEGSGERDDLGRFAARLAQMPIGQADRDIPSIDAAWTALARSAPGARQEARWNVARTLLKHGRTAEAFGALSVMQADEFDLELVPAWRLAYGMALGSLNRTKEALAALSGPGLDDFGRACAWRMRLQVQAEDWQAAAHEFRCAAPAMDAMPAREQRPFVVAGAQTALGIGEPSQALSLLARFEDSDATANLLRGKALIAQGKIDEGLLRLRRAGLAGDVREKPAAQLAIIEAELAEKSLSPGAAAKQLDTILYRWRGDVTERKALKLRWDVAEEMGDERAALEAGASLFRHFDLGKQTRPVLERLQAMLSDLLLDDQRLPLSQAAGIYWEYRDLSPTGGAGDAVAARLADRLADARLFQRAAELLRYQMDNRATDIAKGPLSVRIAELELLAGRPDAALAVMEASDEPAYPQTMLTDRRRMSAIALFRLGKNAEAMTMLDLVPDSAPLKAEMLWHRRDWQRFAKVNAAALPGPAGIDAMAETTVLRQAVALAMQGDEAGLSALRERYGKALADRPAGRALALLTDQPDQVQPGAIEAALAAMPGAPTVGSFGPLLDG
ncbi:hypothetical protein KY084_06110 [Stakelama sp. CBK3Z-3]|uniref:Tetratricopeptide repeat protein n=1 Tax=Stakelama flava TaxID=2860338 RepID=A0ABS6XJT2_9SPHN|nr:hypothetical protein [Stakelama flava]MBW4330447.1 hypothetical protein [Stakelama flava]